MRAPGDAHTVIVGGSVAGVRCLQALRQKGYDGRITLVEAEVHQPYDKPDLSKSALTGTEPRRLLDLAEVDDRDEVVLGDPATGVDLTRSEVALSSGRVLVFSDLVVATGARARRLPSFDVFPNVHYLRSLDDARRLRADLAAARRIVVVGGGFIGGEVASSARERGVDVTIVEAGPRLLTRSMPAEVAEHLQGIYERHGVQVVFDTVAARGVPGDGGVLRSVEMGDGSVVEADLVVIGVGSVPNCEWLASSGMPIDDGLHCGPDLRVAGTDRVFAIGDVARVRSATDANGSTSSRHEHWTSAREQASIAAQNIRQVGSATHRATGFVWSDQFGHRIQHVGSADPGADAVVDVAHLDHGGVIFHHRGATGQVVGATAIDAQREFAAVRRALSLAPFAAV
ncbi:NAD(P)/FAD-dependent oxidoreductase [Nocardioides zeae]|uniref:NAD(P)/FAD-dependent oxidoreductase n=1 Tax=Nocardioides zeae TaxID=1457234 RepID=UPI0027D87E06|nr:FAD-dependent oxidoreductase [Nocardioides zeae]